MHHRHRRTAIACMTVAALAVPAAAQAAPPAGPKTITPPEQPIGVPATGVLTLPTHCTAGAKPVLRVLAGTTAGRCASGRVAFSLRSATMRALTQRQSTAATVSLGAATLRMKLTAGAKRRLKAVTGTWNDATLDCYPWTGGVMGGGNYNNSVNLMIDWHSNTGATVWARHAVWYEEYWNGAGPYYRNLNGQYVNTTPYVGPFQMSPNGVLEWQTVTHDPFGGGWLTTSTPWANEQTYPKSVRVLTRAQVGLATWNGSSWGAPVWHLARPRTAAMGQGEGFCNL
jgi:hypothetical protein